MSTMADAAGTSLRWELALTPSTATFRISPSSLEAAASRASSMNAVGMDLVRGHQRNPHVECVNQVELRAEPLGELEGRVDHRIDMLREIDCHEDLLDGLHCCEPTSFPLCG